MWPDGISLNGVVSKSGCSPQCGCSPSDDELERTRSCSDGLVVGRLLFADKLECSLFFDDERSFGIRMIGSLVAGRLFIGGRLESSLLFDDRRSPGSLLLDDLRHPHTLLTAGWLGCSLNGFGSSVLLVLNSWGCMAALVVAWSLIFPVRLLLPPRMA